MTTPNSRAVRADALLAPIPLALFAVLLIACGFIGGVLVQKGQGGTGLGQPAASTAPSPRGLAALTGAAPGGPAPAPVRVGGATLSRRLGIERRREAPSPALGRIGRRRHHPAKSPTCAATRCT